MGKGRFITEAKLAIPDIKELGRLYQRAIERDHQSTATAAENAALTLGRAEGAITEARVLASFLDEV